MSFQAFLKKFFKEREILISAYILQKERDEVHKYYVKTI
jgi:hypothetical protein